MINNLKIKGIATYKNGIEYIPKKFNFFYGPNGTGKSTISKVLSGELSSAETSVINNDIQEEILVYNKSFIKRNLQTDNGIKGIFTLGEDSIEKRTQILTKKETIEEQKKILIRYNCSVKKQNEEKKQAFEELETKCWKIKNDIETKFPEVIKGFKKKKIFCEKCIDSYENTYNYLTLTDLQKRYNTVYQKDRIEDLKYENINLENIRKYDNNELLYKSITGKNDNDIGEFIEYLNASDWVKEGLVFLDRTENKCPFCQRKLPDNITENIKKYFDKTYEESKEKIEEYAKSYEEIRGEIILVTDNISSNKYDYVDYQQFDLKKNELIVKINSNLNDIEKKRRNLAEVINIDSMVDEAINLHNEIEKINRKIEENNKLLNNQQAKNETNNMVWRYVSNIYKDDITTYKTIASRCDKVISCITQKIDTTNEKIRLLQDGIKKLESTIASIEPTIEAVNNILRGFGFIGFMLSIDENQQGVYKVIRPNGDDASTTLSEGEYNFISFLYFYYLCYGSQRKDEIIKDKILVIDDPMSSMDSNVLFIVSTLVKEMLYKCNEGKEGMEQAFILTHNAYFYKEITYWGRKNQLPVSETKYCILNKRDEDTTIAEYDKNPIKTSYELLWSELRNSDCKSKSYTLNIMRRILEHYFTLLGGMEYEKCIHEFKGSDQLICRALVSFINDGSHSVFEDHLYTPDGYSIENYKHVFELIFDKLNQKEHYDMMMKKDDETKKFL